MPPKACDGRSEDMAMASTLLMTVPWKRLIYSDLDKPTDEFLDDISSTASEDNFYSWDFGMKSDSA